MEETEDLVINEFTNKIESIIIAVTNTNNQ